VENSPCHTKQSENFFPKIRIYIDEPAILELEHKKARQKGPHMRGPFVLHERSRAMLQNPINPSRRAKCARPHHSIASSLDHLNTHLCASAVPLFCRLSTASDPNHTRHSTSVQIHDYAGLARFFICTCTNSLNAQPNALHVLRCTCSGLVNWRKWNSVDTRMATSRGSTRSRRCAFSPRCASGAA